MTPQRRSLDEHIALLTAFAARVSELSAAEWARIEARCAALSEPSFRALLARAALTAKSHELLTPGVAEPRGVGRAIKGVSDAVQHGFGFAIEVIAEFEAASEPDAHLRGPASGAAQARMGPQVAAMVEANRRIQLALLPRIQQHPGVTTAMRAASEALLRHDYLTPAQFSALYQYVAPEIPFTSLEPSAAQP
jgi:hypothetical protein